MNRPMNYQEVEKFLEEFIDENNLQPMLDAVKIAKHYGGLEELTMLQTAQLYELMYNWWFKDDNIGFEQHAETWARMIKDGYTTDQCWDIKWDIIEHND